ncbi:dihydroorotate dehydrogenase [bacterium]|nr:dihydroorotate dehydrogenase [bacterium]
MSDLSLTIGGLVFKNPVITASGTFGYGTEYAPYLDVSRLGGIVTKTITLLPREGNPVPRVAETPAGMLNSIGLANVGVDEFLKRKLPALADLDTRVIVNIAGNTAEEYAAVAAKAGAFGRVDAIEINVSCPNVKQGGLAFGTDPEATYQVVRAVRNETGKVLITKLTPNVTDITEAARAAVEAGSDALSLINTVLGMGIDITTRKPLLARGTGGLSGPAVKPIAIAKVYQAARCVDVPIIGLGGIRQWEDVVEFMLAGASAVQVGTWNFVEPGGAARIVAGLEQYCASRSLARLADLVGTVDIDET